MKFIVNITIIVFCFTDIIKKVAEENCKGKVEIIAGATHNGVRHGKQVYELINKWFSIIK
jgi:hypothetical protein